jgi:hypothetical protein
MSRPATLSVIDPLKVFVEYNTEYDIYVAQCLQTGHLVTADDAEMTKEMITELLEYEVSLAMREGDLSTLLKHPAPIEKWIKWELASKAKTLEPPRIIKVHGEIAQQIRVFVGQAEVETEVRIATGTTATAA